MKTEVVVVVVNRNYLTINQSQLFYKHDVKFSFYLKR